MRDTPVHVGTVLKMRTRVLPLLVLVAAFGLAWTEVPLILDKDSFADTIGAGTPVFVKFFAPWCGHCKRLAPTWDELADKLSGTGIAAIAKVDCTEETALCAEHGVKGYPTLKLFKGPDQVEPYQGARDLESLLQFVTDKVAGEPQQQKDSQNNEVKRETEGAAVVLEKDEHGLLHLTDATFSSMLQHKEGVQFVKFYAPWCGHCKRLAPTWEQLGEHYLDNDNVEIAKVDCTVEKNTCQRYGVKGYPTLILFVDGMVLEKYTGSRTLEDLIEFVEDNRVDK